MSHNKKISFYLPNLDGGGAERVMLNLANNLSESGKSVDLILSKKKGEYISIIHEKINVIDLNSEKVSFSLFKLISVLNKRRSQVLVSALNHANIIASLASLISRSKISHVMTVHNSLLHKKNIYIDFVILLIMRLFSIFSFRVVAVSESVRQELVTKLFFNKKRTIVINNPINSNFIKSQYLNLNIHHKLPKKYIVGCGRLTHQKDFKNLILSYNEVRKINDIELVILGEGEERDSLLSLIKNLRLENKVHLLGFVHNPYVFFRNAEIFVLSSRWEGLPTVLIEAMCCGTQVISTDCPGGSAFILEDGKWGQLTKVGDYIGLSIAINNVLNGKFRANPELRSKAFDENVILKKYLEIL